MVGQIRHDRASGLITGALQLLSPNQDTRPDGANIEVLVIHAISLPENCFGGNYVEQFFLNRLDSNAHPYFAEISDLRVSAHFYINRAGKLTQFVSTLRRAWHAGASSFQGRSRVNDFSIGIEVEGCDHLPFEIIQYEMLANLTRCLSRAYPAIINKHIIGHSEIAPGRKTDPGPYFDWNRYFNMLE